MAVLITLFKSKSIEVWNNLFIFAQVLMIIEASH